MRLHAIVHSRALLVLGVCVAVAVPAITLPRLPHVSPWPALIGPDPVHHRQVPPLPAAVEGDHRCGLDSLVAHPCVRRIRTAGTSHAWSRRRRRLADATTHAHRHADGRRRHQRRARPSRRCRRPDRLRRLRRRLAPATVAGRCYRRGCSSGRRQQSSSHLVRPQWFSVRRWPVTAAARQGFLADLRCTS